VRIALPILLAAALAAPGAALAAAPLPSRDDPHEPDRARVAEAPAPPADFSTPQDFEAMSGGAATSTATIDRDAFSHSSANLGPEGERDFEIGNGLFRKLWVSSPSSTHSSDGLGPLYNARSCQRCHIRDGRGHPPEGPDDTAASMFLRLSVPPRTEAQKRALANRAGLFIPEPTYGGQFQDLAVPGLAAEGRMTIDYTEVPVELSGGETASLRAPRYGVADLGYGPMDPEVMMSPRVAPQMIGVGLLEAIHQGDIEAGADPDDADGDGISGRVSMVFDPVTGDTALGRFGHKASNPSVLSQSSGALAGDIGISSRFHADPAGDCTENQPACRAMPHGIQPDRGRYEAADTVLDLIAFYAGNLAVPARRDVDDPEVLHGKRIFHETGCAACHRPAYVTSRDAGQPEHRFQLIWPYTDLLLHDMGEGLADHRPAGDASGTEWRTAPLWGIGLTETVSGHTYFLHDGRARSLLEAVLWHGGEAQAARDTVVAMDPADRAALIRFLESL